MTQVVDDNFVKHVAEEHGWLEDLCECDDVDDMLEQIELDDKTGSLIAQVELNAKHNLTQEQVDILSKAVNWLLTTLDAGSCEGRVFNATRPVLDVPNLSIRPKHYGIETWGGEQPPANIEWRGEHQLRVWTGKHGWWCDRFADTDEVHAAVFDIYAAAAKHAESVRLSDSDGDKS